MSRFLQPALAPIVIGPILGVLAALTVIETDPAILGWLFGIGVGLMGGAFVAALMSGDALVGGPAASRRRGQNAAPWLDPPSDEER